MARNNKSNITAFNKHKLRVIENSKRALEKLALYKIFLPSQMGGPNSAVLFEGEHPIKPHQSTIWALDNIRTRWFIIAGTFCRDQSGKHYATYTEFQAEREYKFSDISFKAKTASYWMFEQAPNLHRLVPYWIAIPVIDEFKFKPFHLNNLLYLNHFFKGFNRIASNFELNVNKKFVDYHKDKNWFEVLVDWKYKELEESEIARIEQAIETNPESLPYLITSPMQEVMNS